MSEQLDRLKSLLDRLELWEDTIEEALHHGGNAHSFDDIVAMVLQNKVFFFTYPEAFVVMEKVDYPQFSVFHCFLAGGTIEAVMGVQDEMEKVGRELGCKYLSIAGRRGWQRQLQERGWRHICTTLYRTIGELPNEQRKRRIADYNGRVAGEC